MGNPLPKAVQTGTIGELLVQLRLLEFGIQSAPPIKDSGNDLIAIKAETVKYIQVKTRLNGANFSPNLPEIYHLGFYIDLKREGDMILLDESIIRVRNKDGRDLGTLSQDLVDSIWGGGGGDGET